MKKLFSIIFVAMFCGSFAFGQTTKADLEQLRKEIGLPASATVVKGDAMLPTAAPVKIYLAVKHNKESAKDFAEWAAEWNKNNAAQFGELQIVGDIEDADIAAVQFQAGTTRFVREDSVKLRTGKARRENDDVFGDQEDKFGLGSLGNSNVRAETSARNLRLPLYSYLLVRGENSSWIVDYSRVDERLSTKTFPELLLQSEIESRLKNR